MGGYGLHTSQQCPLLLARTAEHLTIKVDSMTSMLELITMSFRQQRAN